VSQFENYSFILVPVSEAKRPELAKVREDEPNHPENLYFTMPH